jgi:hypothetical protein
MLITLLAILLLVWVTRALMLRYGSKRGFANVIAAVVAVAFVAGFACDGLYWPRYPVAAPAPAPPSTAPTVAASAPMKEAIPKPAERTAAQIRALRPLGKPISYSVIESLGGTGPNGDQFAAGSTVDVHGWAGDPATKAAAAGLLMLVDGRRPVDATQGYGGERPDVATAFHSTAMLDSNVSVQLPTVGLTRGIHHLELAAILHDGAHYRVVTVPPKAFTVN